MLLNVYCSARGSGVVSNVAFVGGVAGAREDKAKKMMRKLIAAARSVRGRTHSIRQFPSAIVKSGLSLSGCASFTVYETLPRYTGPFEAGRMRRSTTGDCSGNIKTIEFPSTRGFIVSPLAVRAT